MAHVYYAELLDEFADVLSHMPLPYTLLVSVVDESSRDATLQRMSQLPNMASLIVKLTPNRGRDIAPMMVAFREEILQHDVFCHIHTKKSLYSGQEQSGWRQYLLHGLLGTRQRIAWILGMFDAAANLGMVYPESYRSVPLWGHTWLSNVEQGRELGAQLDIAIEPLQYLDFPAGSMFWARTDAVRPLFELGLRVESFPVEQGQTDGTLQHAIERLLSLAVRRQNMLTGILPADGRLVLSIEGERNRHIHFDASFGDKLTQAAIDAQLISLDIFDTLVLRPFADPSGAREYTGYLAKTQLGIDNFARLRTTAEAVARARTGKDVDLDMIYALLEKSAGLSGTQAMQLRQLELATERRLLRPRQGVLDSVKKLSLSRKRRLIAVSDMYLSDAELREILPPTVNELLEHIYVSSRTGWRKDGDDAWLNIPSREGVTPDHWLHIGDNEHADIQRPQALGFIHPVHVLRPSALLSVVPGLRTLRPAADRPTPWPDQLWLGLVANRFAAIGDSYPQDLAATVHIRDAETFGYVVLGPLILDYIQWIGRTAIENNARKILFLSREGYLLHRLYRRLRAAVPALERVEGTYLLASRRGVNTPALKQLDDLRHAFAAPFTGTIRLLLDTRFGSEMAQMAVTVLGEADVQREVYLPEMTDELIARLRPMETQMLDIAMKERTAYLVYWNKEVDATDKPIVADIGYAGTIQAQLSRLTGEPLGGAYFALTSRANQVMQNVGWAKARFYDERQPPPAIAPVMQHHLLLESLLTAPDGQFSHFDLDSEGRPAASFRHKGMTDGLWTTVQQVHVGIERFVSDALGVLQDHAIDVSLDQRSVQHALQQVGSGHWSLGEWAQVLSVEDLYSGRGQVGTGPARSRRPAAGSRDANLDHSR